MHPKNTRHTSWLAAILILFAAFTSPLSAGETDPPIILAELLVEPASVRFEATGFYHSLTLSVGGPDGEVTQQSTEGVASLSFDGVDDEGSQRPDGRYAYELRGVASPESPSILLDFGTVTIAEGAFVSPDLPEGDVTKDQVIDDELIVDGLCVGLDCADGETFQGFELKLKANNLRMLFEDTSSTGAFASRDWMVRVNDNENGGGENFSIVDCDDTGTACEGFNGLSDEASVPFTLEGGAPANALYVDNTGRIGLGTSTPATAIHALDGNTPTLRLEQDGSSGFSEQVWDVGGNEANFFIRDETNNSNLPFRLQPGAPTNSLYIAADGDIGLGKQNPGAKLDVDGDIVLTGMVDGRDVAADGGILDAHVADFDNPHQVTAEQVGAISQATLDAHTGDFSNPHQVTAEQTGAISQATLDAHTTDFDNPHQVTAEQTGAISQAALDAHTTDFDNPHQVTAEQVGAISQAALDAHTTDFDNPHQVTAEQVGAASLTAFDEHAADFDNPHQVTAEQIGAASIAALNEHAADTNNPHQVTAEQTGAASITALNEHAADTNNPHQVTAEQTGAASVTALNEHAADTNNPHQVTAAQTGADVAGSAAIAIAAHEAAFNHANLPSALPVPVAEGGTGSTDAATARANLGIVDDPTQVGLLAAAAFGGSPATASVTFETPYAAGTTYAVLLTPINSDPSNLVTANVIALDETGFTVAVSGNTASLTAVSWMVRPALVATAVTITSPANGSAFTPTESFQVDYSLATADGVRAYLGGVVQLEQIGSGPLTLTAPAADGLYELRLEAIDASGTELGASDAIQIEVSTLIVGVGCTVVAPNVWNNGYTLDVTVSNDGSETISAWAVALQFTEPTTFGNFWNAQLTLSADGTRVDAVNVSHNGTLAPGQSATFGLQGTHDGTFELPTCSDN